MSADRISIYTDGACRGNPGPGGWGVVIKGEGITRELSGGCPDTTSNRMELTAVIEALKVLPVPSKVHLFSDSTYVINGATKWLRNWKAKGWRGAGNKRVANPDLWQELDRLKALHKVKWEWIRGHDGNPGNERADVLANLAIDLPFLTPTEPLQEAQEAP